MYQINWLNTYRTYDSSIAKYLLQTGHRVKLQWILRPQLLSITNWIYARRRNLLLIWIQHVGKPGNYFSIFSLKFLYFSRYKYGFILFRSTLLSNDLTWFICINWSSDNLTYLICQLYDCTYSLSFTIRLNVNQLNEFSWNGMSWMHIWKNLPFLFCSCIVGVFNEKKRHENTEKSRTEWNGSLSLQWEWRTSYYQQLGLLT